MATPAPRKDFTEGEVRTKPPEKWATGLPAIAVTAKRSLEETGAITAVRSLLKLNQTDGFDCPGCAWPDPDAQHRKAAEFCENGAKHLAAETTTRRVGRDWFAAHPVSEMAARSDWWLEEQGRIVEPVVKRAGEDHYQPVTWEEALAFVAEELRSLASPDEAAFYTSGRASNEAAFVYQLFARAFGTNNLPDCSNMCHESSGTALTEAIGIGKGSCTIDDLENAQLIVICGQNPGTNHPRMLSHLEAAKRNGATIVAVNPLPEAGLLRFKNPQSPLESLGRGTEIADELVQVRLAGDQALFLGVGKALLEIPGATDDGFVESHTAGFDEYQANARQASWADIEAGSGVSRRRIEHLAELFSRSGATIVCWAMGLTQHRNSVASIREITNVLFLQGNIGKRGAGVFPVRGHSNVQGDRTMGIWERMSDRFLDSVRDEFGFDPPRSHGWDSVKALEAMRDGRAKVLVSLGGNLVRAISDSTVAEASVRRLRLSVSIATKLNRSHAVTGEAAVILPTLGRSERDPAGAVTVEDSIGQVHESRGSLRPASTSLRSETAIICGLASRVLADRVPVPWEQLGSDYSSVRERIARVIPGFEDFNNRVSRPGGFLLPHPPRDSRTFETPDGKAHFSADPLVVMRVPPGRLLLQTLRSHDQFNTTIYGYNDRYRGIHGGRQVVLVNPTDLARLGLAGGDRVDVVSEWEDGVDRRMRALSVVAYPTSEGCCAAYYPEANVLVPLASVAEGSNTPASKSVIVRLERV